MTLTKDQEILDALAAGPVRRRKLLAGRKASFRLAYQRVLGSGLIVERGNGVMGQATHVGLPGAAFPVKRRLLRVKTADVKILVFSGRTEEEARAELQRAIDSPGDNYSELFRVCCEAQARIDAMAKRAPDGCIRGLRTRSGYVKKNAHELQSVSGDK